LVKNLIHIFYIAWNGISPFCSKNGLVSPKLDGDDDGQRNDAASCIDNVLSNLFVFDCLFGSVWNYLDDKKGEKESQFVESILKNSGSSNDENTDHSFYLVTGNGTIKYVSPRFQGSKCKGCFLFCTSMNIKSTFL
jgi:hypothetical protein